jgi:hypothetical protein
MSRRGNKSRDALVEQSATRQQGGAGNPGQVTTVPPRIFRSFDKLSLWGSERQKTWQGE